MKNVVLIIHAFRDLILGWIPWPHRNGGFAFLVHPRDLKDVYRKYPFTRKLPDRMLLFLLKHYWPVVVSEVTGLKFQKDKRPIKGWIITIPLTAHQMMERRNYALRKILHAMRLAKNLGAEIVGLGALTASVSRGGLDLINKVDIYITTGHAYTSYIVTLNLFKFIELFNLNKKAIVVAIVGAAGSVGSTSAKILALEGIKNIILIDIERKNYLLKDLINDLEFINNKLKIEVSHQIESVRNADFIITATNAPEAVIHADDLKPGAVVIDDAQPSDISPDVFIREDVLAIEGGIIHTPEINTHFNFGLKDRHDNFCCLGEIMILASARFKNHYGLGRGVSLDEINRIREMAKGMNFRLAEFQNFNESIKKEKLEYIKSLVQKNNLKN